ncbi:hypothetical protein [Fusobacterium sp.]|uniref:hypothetical protein n=2 Tax=Fusobacterium sp. TaxID=68766 RepID=UPI002602C1B1|nr:hypothetical protein [Fusobacterium sp.]
MKKLVLGLMLLSSLTMFAGENVVIDKEVTGVNKETIETREVANKKINLEQKEVNASEMKTSSNKIKEGQESLEVKNSDDEIKKELASDVSKESSIWKYVLGVIGVIAVAVAL